MPCRCLSISASRADIASRRLSSAAGSPTDARNATPPPSRSSFRRLVSGEPTVAMAPVRASDRPARLAAVEGSNRGPSARPTKRQRRMADPARRCQPALVASRRANHPRAVFHRVRGEVGTRAFARPPGNSGGFDRLLRYARQAVNHRTALLSPASILIGCNLRAVSTGRATPRHLRGFGGIRPISK